MKDKDSNFLLEKKRIFMKIIINNITINRLFLVILNKRSAFLWVLEKYIMMK